MKEYTPKTFTLPALDGISTKSVEEHIGLYQAYVKNFNAMTTLIGELHSDSAKNGIAIAELVRRRSFEWGGMRLHELYFSQWEAGAVLPSTDSAFAQAVAAQYGTLDTLVAQLKQTGMMRGPGWSLLYFDKASGEFHIGFSGEQHIGHFADLPIILALDVWEHAFLLDYGAAGKAKYIDAFFKNLNWSVVEKRFSAVA